MADDKPKFTLDEAFGTLTYEVLAPSARSLGDWLPEAFPQLSAYMRGRFRLIFEKVGEKLDARGASQDTRALPPGATIDALEGAAKEDDGEILDMWIGLIANSLDSRHHAELKKIFVRQLRDLSADEALFLRVIEFLPKLKMDIRAEMHTGNAALLDPPPEIQRWAQFNLERRRRAAEALIHHGLVKRLPSLGPAQQVRAVSVPTSRGRDANLLEAQSLIDFQERLDAFLNQPPPFSERRPDIRIGGPGRNVHLYVEGGRVFSGRPATEAYFSFTAAGKELMAACADAATPADVDDDDVGGQK